MTISEAKTCRDKRGYIDGTPFATMCELTGDVMCYGYTDYNVINPITGKIKRIVQVAVLKYPIEPFSSIKLVDREHVRLLER